MENPFRLSYAQTETIEHNEDFALEGAISPFKEELFVSGIDETLGQPLEKDLEFELFANQAHDLEFEEALAELAGGAEEKFLNFSGKNELEEALLQTDFEEKFERFFDSEYGTIAEKLEMEIDRFSSYLKDNINSEMTDEEIESLIENFQVAEPEQFFGFIKKAFKKVKKGITSIAKKGLKLVKKVALGPLGFVLSKIIKKIKPLLKPFLKRVLKAGLAKIPRQYRSLAKKLLKGLKLGELETSEVNQAAEAFEPETYDELEIENQLMESLFYEGPSEEAEVESYYQEFPAVAELENEFDRQLFEVSEAELSGQTYEGITSEYFESQEIYPTENETIDLENARNMFINGLNGESPDIQKLTEEFIPAIMVALRLGIRLIGRKRVVNTIAKLVSKLIGPLVGKKLASPLSKVLVDVGFKLISLETSEPVNEAHIIAPMIANIVAETVDKVSEFPENILNADDEILQSYVQEALVESIANNFPSETLKDEFLIGRKLPIGANWVPRRRGKYKVLSKAYKFTLDPNTARKISTLRHGETLHDVLRQQSWDGNSQVAVVVRVFEAVPGTRLSMIARDYLGACKAEQLRQILPLTRTAARLLLKNPRLSIRKRASRPTRGNWSYIVGRRFYIVKLVKMGEIPKRPVIGKPTSKNEAVGIKFIAPKILELRLYLNEETSQKLKGIAQNRLVVQLSKTLVTNLLQIGSKTIHNLLARVKIPQFVIKRIIALFAKWVERNLNSKARELTQKFVNAAERPGSGVTVKLKMELPFSFAELLKINPLTMGSFLSNIIKSTPDAKIEVMPGYML